MVKCATIRASICSIGRSLVLRLLEHYPGANRLLEKRHKENDKFKRLNTAKLRADLKRFDLCVRTELYEMFSAAAVDLTKNPMMFTMKLTELTRIVDNGINISLAATEFEDPNKWDTRCENFFAKCICQNMYKTQIETKPKSYIMPTYVYVVSDPESRVSF